MALLGGVLPLQIRPDSCYAEHEGELGFCILCDTEILERVDKFHLRPNSEYREVYFEFSNKSLVKIAFCKKHFEELKEEDYSKVMEGVKHGWETEFKFNNWTEEQINQYKENYFNLSIARRVNEKEIIANN